MAARILNAVEAEETQPWSMYSIEIYASRQPPALGTVNINEIEEQARKKLEKYPESFNYVFGSAGMFNTYKSNLNAYHKWKIVPRMLVNATVRNLETTIFGKKYPSPILLAPIGVQGLMHPEAELGSCKAATEMNVPFIMSTASSRSIEQTAEASGEGTRFYQIYWPKTEEITLSLLSRAKANGFQALFVTLDTNILGWRPLDLQKAVMPFFHGVGTAVGFSDPVFMARHGLKPDHTHPKFPYEPAKFDKKLQEGDKETGELVERSYQWLQEINHGTFRSWEDVAFLRKNWDKPLILKGIQRVEDAEKALVIGADGIVVSNHGGRQVDGAIGSLEALGLIMKSNVIRKAQRKNKFTVFFDSGIRNGSDIMKAIALGANAVLIGRPYVYGLACGGQEGVQEVIKSLLAELDLTLGLAGYRSLDEIRGKADTVLMHEKEIAAKL